MIKPIAGIPLPKEQSFIITLLPVSFWYRLKVLPISVSEKKRMGLLVVYIHSNKSHLWHNVQKSHIMLAV